MAKRKLQIYVIKLGGLAEQKLFKIKKKKSDTCVELVMVLRAKIVAQSLTVEVLSKAP